MPATILAVLAGAGIAAAQPAEDLHGSAGFALFVDDLDTVIWSPHANAGSKLFGDIDIEAAWTSDVISSASVDVVSAATSRMTETRQELGLRASREQAFADIDIDGGYTYSFENDSDSHIIQLGARRGFDDDNIELSVRYGVSFNRTGVLGESSSAWRSLLIHSGEIGITRILGKRTVADLAYSTFWADGYQVSPYRRVPIEVGPDLRGAMWVDENAPETRWRNAIVGRVRHAIGDRWVIAADYRFYLDDWGVVGHTENVEVNVELAYGLALRLQQRASLQGGADFYRKNYTQFATYRTRDRRLSPQVSGLAGGMLLWNLGAAGPLGKLSLYVAFDALGWRYDEFDAPELDPMAGSDLRSLGWVLGSVTQFGLELRP